ncbi:MAG: D-glycero-beta-D-manno-heptose 1-phosphate adenylyltransferase [Candidatus Eisenbacteria bacterium]
MKTESARARVVALDELLRILGPERKRGRRVVFTNGCFDLLHPGHVALLEEAAGHGDLLVVGLNTDASVRRLKGPGRPLVAERDRALLVAALRPVDWVVLFDEDTPGELIEALLPDVLVKGADYALDEIVGREAVEAHGGQVIRIQLVAGYSSTSLRDRLRSREQG